MTVTEASEVLCPKSAEITPLWERVLEEYLGY